MNPARFQTIADLIGKRIKARRTELWMTQAELAEGAHVTEGFVAEVERGGIIPSMGASTRMAEALGCSLESLAGG
ncbi:MAG: helix-turn-helix transcriptional regulator [Gammaproteobacteria bacterium]|nr:helix-turn-helix transcriptional regulator [Gammaproteobacteria bacterium]MDE0273541.1 helix-turn-helix transcriptional regulator [Gammaproteobacteria bacterium]